jgi:UDP-N-acetylmuramoyl-tripeptide--D-alanyl-D-alanine ligase
VGSYNSEVGVPLTVCRVERDTRFLVVEMGARGIGHIAYLARMAPPRVGVVLNVGTAHVGEFGSREAIARAKSELPAALPAEGLAVLNADDPAVRAMAEVTVARVVLVGEAADAGVRATDVDLDAHGRPSFTVHTAAGTRAVRLGLVGRHHVGNALAVLAVALELGLALDAACDALEAARPVSRWRMEVTERVDGVTLVNDAYNANPDSMRAALSALERMGEGRRTWAVLGTMLELGDDSDALHAEVGAEVVARGVDELVVVGAAAEPLAAGARAAGGATSVRIVPDAAAAEALLRAELRRGDVVLFKSSRDAGLRLLGDRIATTTEEQQT